MKYILLPILIVLLVFSPLGCSGRPSNLGSKTSHDFAMPTFTSIDWPAPYTELPEGKLTITGNLECEAGYFSEMPIAVYLWPVPLIEPAISVAATPGSPVTVETLQTALIANQIVQNWIGYVRNLIIRRVTEGPFVLLPEETVKGGNLYPLFPEDFNDFEYFDFETGDFRVDFEENTRLKSGYPLLIMVFGIDQLGAASLVMNIYDVEDIAPELTEDEKNHAFDFANQISDLGFAIIETLAFSGDDRNPDIQLIFPFINLFNGLYSGYEIWRWDEIADTFLNEATMAANAVEDQDLKDGYIKWSRTVAHGYEMRNFWYWSNHYVLLQGETLLNKYQNAHDYIIDKYDRYGQEFTVEDRSSSKALTVLLYDGETLFAQFEVIADPEENLVVTGFIGGHTIVPDDYNPYFFKIIGILLEEGFPFPVNL